MNLLHDIQVIASDTRAPLESALLKAKILGARLKSDALRNWVNSELDGYTDTLTVPSYRVVPCTVIGSLSMPFGRMIQNMRVPISKLPEQLHRELSRREMRNGISALESLIRDSEHDVLHIRLAPEVTAFISQQNWHEQEAALVDASMQISVTAIQGILGVIRSRLLDLVLDIESHLPQAGQISGEAISQRELSGIVQAHVYGGNVAIQSHHFSQVHYGEVVKGDVDSLVRSIKSIGVPESDAEELRGALSVDPAPTRPGVFGTQVATWLSNAMRKAASGAWDVTANAVGGVIAACISKYYGLS